MKIKLPLVSFLLATALVSAQNPDEQRKIVNSYDLKKTTTLLHAIEKDEKAREAKVNTYLRNNPSAKIQFSTNDKLYRIVDVIEGQPLYITTDSNVDGAKASKINKLYPGGGLGLNLEGQNMLVGVWDGGPILASHTEFLNAAGTASRVTNVDAGDADGHGTHVGGTIGARGAVTSGANAAAKGMAPKVNIRSYNWNNDLTEIVTEVTTNAMLISNHSYGTPTHNEQGTQLVVPNWYMGCYSDVAVTWDNLLYTYPYYLMVASAGNSGDLSYTGGLGASLDKLTGNKNSKNNLVIANANPSVNFLSGNLTALAINPSSSQGPSDDGRIKPDIAADGTNVLSTYNTGGYATLTGTSMASPTVAGGLILLQEHYHNLNASYMKSATLKGLVCHTALDDATLDDFANPGPDPRFGWGLLDAQAAANAITKDAANQALILESELNLANPTYTMTFSVTDATDLKATICWLDPAGTNKNGSLNSTVPALVNDLDLRITKGSETYFPWKLNLANLNGGAIKGDNLVDNVERVDVPLSAGGGQYTITVSHKSFLMNDGQPFSLILTGNGVTLNRMENEFKTISVFPNPAKDVLNFNVGELAQISDISIVDVSGKVFTPRFDLNSKTIDVSNLQSGVYFVRFTSQGQSFTKKFMKL